MDAPIAIMSTFLGLAMLTTRSVYLNTSIIISSSVSGAGLPSGCVQGWTIPFMSTIEKISQPAILPNLNTPDQLTIQVIHFKSIWVLALIPHRNLDNLSILIPDFCRGLFDDLVDDLGILFRKPSEQGWDTLWQSTVGYEENAFSTRLTIIAIHLLLCL